MIASNYKTKHPPPDTHGISASDFKEMLILSTECVSDSCESDQLFISSRLG